MINFPIYEEIPEPYFQDLQEKERKELETKVNQCLAALHESCK